MDGYLSIGRLAKRAGVSVETVRYYEARGLLPNAARSAAGYRQYAPESLRHLRFVQRAKTLGFSLKEIRELLALKSTPGASCADMKRRAQARLNDVETRLDDLERLRNILKRLSKACSGEGGLDGCPILQMLEGRENEH